MTVQGLVQNPQLDEPSHWGLPQDCPQPSPRTGHIMLRHRWTGLRWGRPNGDAGGGGGASGECQILLE